MFTLRILSNDQTIRCGVTVKAMLLCHLIILSVQVKSFSCWLSGGNVIHFIETALLVQYIFFETNNRGEA
jgi:hypothetical protein